MSLEPNSSSAPPHRGRLVLLALSAIFPILRGALLGGLAIVFVLFAILATVVIWLLAIWFWNAFMVSFLGAQAITSLGGAVLFLLGISFLGRVVGFLSLVGAAWVFFTGGAINVLDMSLGAQQLLFYGLFLLVVSAVVFPESSSSSSRIRTSASH